MLRDGFQMVFERPRNVLTPEEHCLSYFSAAITKHPTEATQGIVYFGSQFEGFLDHCRESVVVTAALAGVAAV